MEYAGKMTLKQYMSKMKSESTKLYESDVRPIFKQILLAIDYLHNKNIAHLDLKLENILYQQYLSNNSEKIKLIDFGFSRECKPNQKLDFICGTPNYMCPELLAKKQYIGQQADVWALGVILFVLLKGDFPFKGNNEQDLLKNILANNIQIKAGLEISKEAMDLVLLMLQNTNQLRPTSNKILQHPWLSI